MRTKNIADFSNRGDVFYTQKQIYLQLAFIPAFKEIDIESYPSRPRGRRSERRLRQEYAVNTFHENGIR